MVNELQKLFLLNLEIKGRTLAVNKDHASAHFPLTNNGHTTDNVRILVHNLAQCTTKSQESCRSKLPSLLYAEATGWREKVFRLIKFVYFGAWDQRQISSWPYFSICSLYCVYVCDVYVWVFMFFGFIYYALVFICSHIHIDSNVKSGVYSHTIVQRAFSVHRIANDLYMIYGQVIKHMMC